MEPATPFAVSLHREVVGPFFDLRRAAAADGIDLTPVSGFRSFEKQAAIWNAKWNGERALHDARGEPVDHAGLAPDGLARAILTWSAVPGASRHHWGTDIDVIDAASRPRGYELQLLPHEFAEGGPFYRLHLWLCAHMGRFGFFFPYREHRGGICVEPWHISYAPLSLPALENLTPRLLAETLLQRELDGKETLLRLLPEIFTRYVTNVTPPESSTPPNG